MQASRGILAGPARWGLEFLRLAPRHREMRWRLLGRPLRLLDSASTYWALRGIFLDGEYAFDAGTAAPRVVDVGANIGLSVLYFKHLYPRSRITAFEPDPRAFACLDENLRVFGHRDVELRNEAVWLSDGRMAFAADGADGGSLTPSEPGRPLIQVPTTRLGPALAAPVDLLKIDIEGAETAVLEECAAHLGGVRRIFVEYHSLAGQPQTLGRLLQVLGDAGFRVRLRPATSEPEQPFLAPPATSGLDLQVNIFAIRER